MKDNPKKNSQKKFALIILGLIVLIVIIISILYSPYEVDTNPKYVPWNSESLDSVTPKEDSARPIEDEKVILPEDLTYRITKDESDENLEKNQITVVLSQKINFQQIEFLANKLYKDYPVRRRFYIFYFISGFENNGYAWATSHFDPDLKIEIIGSQESEDIKMYKTAKDFKGDIIGRWHEEKFTSHDFVMFRKSGKTFLKTIYKDGDTRDEEMTVTNTSKGKRYDYSDGSTGGEYFIINSNGVLEFYNDENIKFTTGSVIN